MDNLLNVVSVPAIAAVVYWVMNLIKYTVKNNEKFLHFVPMISAALGVGFGLVAFYLIPGIVPTDNVFVAVVIGGASGLSATGFNQIIKQAGKYNENKGSGK